jgi:histidine triad (HIT) family protein
MDDCIFCKIVAGQIPAFKVYEDDNYLAFLDISHFTEGHTLVIPKKHYRYVWDVEDIGGYFEVVKKITDHYRTLGYKAIDTLTFGRKVPHAHVHIVPNNGDDPEWDKALHGLEFFFSEAHAPLDKETGNKLAAKLHL